MDSALFRCAMVELGFLGCEKRQCALQKLGQVQKVFLFLAAWRPRRIDVPGNRQGSGVVEQKLSGRASGMFAGHAQDGKVREGGRNRSEVVGS